jgi:glycosyltransferase involved in cell wall biosynthesis
MTPPHADRPGPSPPATHCSEPQLEQRTYGSVSIVVPARNEEVSLGACLRSLVAQAGVAREIIVVDDNSTDQTRTIAASFSGVRVLEAAPLPPGWCGKANACQTGANAAQGNWLLFTDADTVHRPGSLARALEEARQRGADLLSYSPAQDVHGLLQRALMPLIFAELACTFRPQEVSDPNLPAAAANGQYLLISRAAYDEIGGHAAVASDLLEDVALARAIKRAGYKLSFRFGGEAVRTHMYRSWKQMREGWTKNLALLFPSVTALALRRIVEFGASVGAFTTALVAAGLGMYTLALFAAVIAAPT